MSLASLCSQKLPLVRKSQLFILLAQLRRERVEGRGQAQDRQRGLVGLLAAAGALDDHAAETAVAADRDFQDRVARAAARDLREIERAEPFDLAPPGVDVRCQLRLARVGNDLERAVRALA